VRNLGLLFSLFIAFLIISYVHDAVGLNFFPWHVQPAVDSVLSVLGSFFAWVTGDTRVLSATPIP